MKKVFAGLVILLLIIVLVPVLFFGMMGFVPGLSSVLGTDKPKDLGIKFSSQDLSSARSKSQLKYETLPENSNPLLTRTFSGARAVNASFSSAEISATLNNQPWKYWPYRNMQVKFNGDGSAEVSGKLVKDVLPQYAAAIRVPEKVVELAVKYLPADPVFYVKGKAALSDNKVSVFEPQAFEIGRLAIPLSTLLSFNKFSIVSPVLAADLGGLTDELSKVANKKQLIIDFINARLSQDFGQFYAKSASFKEDKLFFDGTLTESISYTP